MNNSRAHTAGERWLRLASPPERMSIGHHNGPGLRISLWVQGCSLRCTSRCLNQHLIPDKGGHLMPASRLTASLRRLAADYRQVEGITVLGGEPFDQAAALAAALAPVRAQGLSIMVYTGHLWEDLRASHDSGARALLALCDILVDGPFLAEQHDDSLVWRGSRNQRILRLSDRYGAADVEHGLERQRRAFYLARSPGDMVVAGAQNPTTARDLRRAATTLPSLVHGSSGK